MSNNIIASSQITLVDLNDAKSLSGFVTANQPKIQIFNPNDSTFTPDWSTAQGRVVITPELYVTGTATNIINQAKSITWYEAGNATAIASGSNGYTIGATNPRALTIAQNKMASKNTQGYICEIVWTDTTFNADITVKVGIEFTKVSSGQRGEPGQNAATAMLTNETHSIPTDAAGNNGNFSGASTTMSVFIGATDDSTNWLYTAAASGVTLSGTGHGTASLANRTISVTAMSGDTGFVDVTATKSGQSLTKRFNLFKNRQGTAGLNAISYDLNVDSKIVQRSVTGAITPGNLTVRMTSQTGTAAPVNYAGRLTIEEHNGTAWTLITQSSANTTPAPNNFATNNVSGPITYTPSATARQVRFRMYVTNVAPTNGTNVFDEEVVQIVSDGAAVTSILTNDHHSVPTDAAGNNGVFTSATTTMSVFVGSVDDSANWTFSRAVSSGVTASGSGTPANRIASVTAMTVDSGTVTLTATRAGYPTQVKTFTVNKNRQGIQGLAANQYWLAVDASTMSISSTGATRTYTPASINITAKTQLGTGTPTNYNGRIVVQEFDGTTWHDRLTGTADTTTWPLNFVPTAYATRAVQQVRVRLFASGATTNLLDEEVIPILSDGAGITATLTNETVSIPTLEDGTGFSLTGITTRMDIFVGTTNDSASWGNITQSGATGLTGTISGKTFTVTGLTADIGWVDLSCTRSGFGTVTRRFTVIKNRQGISSTSYWLVNPPAIGRQVNGTYVPSALTSAISAMSQRGTAAAAPYAGRFIIDQSQDGGTNWSSTGRYTSSANESSIARYPASGTFTAGTNRIRVRLFEAGGTTNLLDEEIIQVISDGATGQNAIIANVWAPKGNIVKNSEGNVEAQCDVYDGSTLATTGVSYQWFKMDTSVSTDQGGGVGWRKLDTNNTGGGTTGWTAKVLVIPHTAVTSMTSFKCVATFSSRTVSDVLTVVDQSDPIQITIISAQGNVFRNGVGNKNITAKVYQGGTEIDQDGSTYEYRWFLYNESGALSTPATFVDTGKNHKTGKSIVVLDTHVTNIGNLVLELWTK